MGAHDFQDVCGVGDILGLTIDDQLFTDETEENATVGELLVDILCKLLILLFQTRFLFGVRHHFHQETKGNFLRLIIWIGKPYVQDGDTVLLADQGDLFGGDHRVIDDLVVADLYSLGKLVEV